MTIIPFLNRVNDLILNPLILLMFGLAFVYFIYGIIKFLSVDVADKSREDSKNAILWGMVGMLVMFSVYGLIRFILYTFGIDDVSPGAKEFIIR